MPRGWNGAGGKRGEKKPGTPNSMPCVALASFKVSRAPRSEGATGAANDELTSSQNSRSRATRVPTTLPTINAALIAPIEMPATQLGSR